MFTGALMMALHKDSLQDFILLLVVTTESYWSSSWLRLELLSEDRRVDHYWNIKNSNGDTPVMYCLKNNKIEMARCLINTPGVDLDTLDRDGKNLKDIARERNLT